MKFAYKLCVFEFFSSYSIKSRKFAMECYSGNMAVVLVVLVEILNVESVLFLLVFDPFKQKASTEFANHVPFLIMFFL
jgi:ABC-type lipoprotein release transport system permease subunit